MSDLTENEILDRHMQALGEADGACQRLKRNADEEYLALRSPDYMRLQDSLKLLEGTCRQMAHWRADARWIKLGFVYARAMRASSQRFGRSDWLWFGELRALFLMGHRRLGALKDNRTGAFGPLLPQAGQMDFLQMPDVGPPPGPRLKLVTH